MNSIIYINLIKTIVILHVYQKYYNVHKNIIQLFFSFLNELLKFLKGWFNVRNRKKRELHNWTLCILKNDNLNKILVGVLSKKR